MEEIINRIGDFLNFMTLLSLSISILMILTGVVGVIIALTGFTFFKVEPIILIMCGCVGFVGSLVVGFISTKMIDYKKK